MVNLLQMDTDQLILVFRRVSWKRTGWCP